MGNRVTIQDIADELGLSRNTVSKALNNSEGLAEATRERIIQKAMEMGYKQFAYVNTLMSTQQPSAIDPLSPILTGATSVAIFSANFLGGSHFASLMLDSFQNQLAQIGLTVSMHRVNMKHVAERQLPPTFHAENTTAVICFEMFDRDYCDMLCQLDMPILFVDGPAQTDGYRLQADMLSMENRSGVTRLVTKAIAAGRKRIGFLGNYVHCNSFFERYAAFRLAMMLQGQPVEEKFCIVEDWQTDFDELDELPDLFICANDFVALDALRMLRRKGYEVPRDVWLAGFDDSGESRACTPALTTVHIHTQIMAVCAVDLLRSRMGEPSLDYRTVYTETNLIIRDSTPLP